MKKFSCHQSASFFQPKRLVFLDIPKDNAEYQNRSKQEVFDLAKTLTAEKSNTNTYLNKLSAETSDPILKDYLKRAITKLKSLPALQPKYVENETSRSKMAQRNYLANKNAWPEGPPSRKYDAQSNDNDLNNQISQVEFVNSIGNFVEHMNVWLKAKPPEIQLVLMNMSPQLAIINGINNLDKVSPGKTGALSTYTKQMDIAALRYLNAPTRDQKEAIAKLIESFGEEFNSRSDNQSGIIKLNKDIENILDPKPT